MFNKYYNSKIFMLWKLLVVYYINFKNTLIMTKCNYKKKKKKKNKDNNNNNNSNYFFLFEKQNKNK